MWQQVEPCKCSRCPYHVCRYMLPRVSTITVVVLLTQGLASPTQAAPPWLLPVQCRRASDQLENGARLLSCVLGGRMLACSASCICGCLARVSACSRAPCRTSAYKGSRFNPCLLPCCSWCAAGCRGGERVTGQRRPWRQHSAAGALAPHGQQAHRWRGDAQP